MRNREIPRNIAQAAAKAGLRPMKRVQQGLVQMNARVQAELLDRWSVLSVYSDLTKEQMVEVALRRTMGSKDPWVLEKAKKIEEIAGQLSLSFNPPDCQPDREKLAA